MNTELAEALAKRIANMQLQLDAIAMDNRTANVAAPRNDEAVKMLSAQVQHLASELKALRSAVNDKADHSALRTGDRGAIKTVIEAVVPKIQEMREEARQNTDKRIASTVGQIQADVSSIKGISSATIEHARETLLARADKLAS